MRRSEVPPGGQSSASAENKTRRWFLDRGGKALAGSWTAARLVGRCARYASWRIPVATAAIDQEAKLAELDKTESNIILLPGQKERFESKEYKKRKDGVLVIGGATVQNSKNIAESITNGLEELGPVMAVDWSHTGLDVQSLAKDLKHIKRQYGMKNLSLYFHSMGDIEAGMLMPLIADKFRVPMMIFDDSIVDLNDVNAFGIPAALSAAEKSLNGQIPEALSEAGKLLTDLPFSPIGPIGARIIEDGGYYHNLLNRGSATEDVAWDQLRAARDGRKYLPALAAVAKRDHTCTVLLQPDKPQDDQIIYDNKAAIDLHEYFPKIHVYHLKGDAGHADELQHPQPYNSLLPRLIVPSIKPQSLDWRCQHSLCHTFW